MADLLLKDVNEVYPGGTRALFDLNLTVRDRELLVLVGPAECGKSTVLRLIAGLEEITSGEIYIEGKLVNGVAPKDRDIAMVFQNNAPFPQLNVYDNMAFSLKMRKLPAEIIDARVKQAAVLLGLSDCLNRKTKSLTALQKQRVALGRTVVREPKVILLDEPFSNLDAKLRAQMREEVCKLHVRVNRTFIFATENQAEAMTMATRIVVMKDGFMQQADTPRNLYDYPVNLFVADFIGSPSMNLFRGASLAQGENGVSIRCGETELPLPEEIVSRIKNREAYADPQKKIVFGIRPEDVRVTADPDAAGALPAQVAQLEPHGAQTLVTCECDLGKVTAFVPTREGVRERDRVALTFDVARAHLFDEETEYTMLERDANYERLAENAETDYLPPTPQEMRRLISAAGAKEKRAAGHGKTKRNGVPSEKNP